MIPCGWYICGELDSPNSITTQLWPRRTSHTQGLLDTQLGLHNCRVTMARTGVSSAFLSQVAPVCKETTLAEQKWDQMVLKQHPCSKGGKRFQVSLIPWIIVSLPEYSPLHIVLLVRVQSEHSLCLGSRRGGHFRPELRQLLFPRVLGNWKHYRNVRWYVLTKWLVVHTAHCSFLPSNLSSAFFALPCRFVFSFPSCPPQPSYYLFQMWPINSLYEFMHTQLSTP